MRIGKAFFESGAEAKPADAEVKTEKVIDKTAAEGTQLGGEGSGDNLTGQGSANDGNGNTNPTEQGSANDGESSNGGEDDTKPAGQDSTNEGEGGADASATEEVPKKGKVGRPAKK